jgi:hypothetical protein
MKDLYFGLLACVRTASVACTIDEGIATTFKQHRALATRAMVKKGRQIL